MSDIHSPPPREVPCSVRLRVLFGGFHNQFGWIFLGFGLIFVWIFAAHADVASILLFRLQTSTTIGIVESVRSTNATENGVPIYEVKYLYIDDLGRQHHGTSFTNGDPGEKPRVTVEYVSVFTSISRAEGMRRTIFGPLAALSMIFPAVGVGFLTYGIRYGLKASRLLCRGRITYGKLVSTESTGMRINNRQVLKLTFTFRAEDGLDWEAIAKTHEPEDLQDEVEEPLLYDVSDPSYAVLLDDLPGATEFDSSGRLVAVSFFETFKILVIPGLSIVGHGTYLLISILGLL